MNFDFILKFWKTKHEDKVLPKHMRIIDYKEELETSFLYVYLLKNTYQTEHKHKSLTHLFTQLGIKQIIPRGFTQDPLTP